MSEAREAGSDGRVLVRFFAHYRDLAGVSAYEATVPHGATVGQLVRLLRADSRFESLPEDPVIAVNQEYASPEQLLADGDEVAMIPPVSGG